MLKLYMLLIGIFMHQVLGCTNVCKYDKENPTKICYAKALDCLILECNEIKDLPIWIRQSNQTNVTLAQNFMNYFPNSYNISSYFKLVILSVQAVDSGVDSFFVVRENTQCKFSVFAYDLNNWNGTLSVSGKTKLVNSTESFDVELKTFSKNIPISLKYEALPIDYLLFNESRIDSSECQGTMPWLNCLQADFELELNKCVDRLNYTVGYGFEYDYSPVTNLTPKNYSHSLSISCKLEIF